MLGNWSKQKLKSISFSFLLAFNLACNMQGSPRSGKLTNGTKLTQPNGGNTNGGNGATTGTEVTSEDIMDKARIELTHLVDPYNGSYKKKITIPKNFNGYLYIAGLNLSTLHSKIFNVRLTLGKDNQQIIVPAIVATAPGITTTTKIEVLVLDMTSRPFQNLTLGYDLYDYNEYPSDGSKEIVTDPRDDGLYCRGLNIEYDPTFAMSSNKTACDTSGDKCLYSYAKVKDAGLYYTASAVNYVLTPTTTNIGDPSSNSERLTRCLPDSNSLTSVQDALNVSTTPTPGALALTDSGVNYYYKGPYRHIGETTWQISSGAYKHAQWGLYADSVTSGGTTYYFNSFLFPRAGKWSLRQGAIYLGSENPFDPKNKLTMSAPGTSKYIDGCNLRVSSFNSTTNETMGSCNVTANIEVVQKDSVTGGYTVLAASSGLKIQMIRASLTDTAGKEIFSSNFRACTTSSQCGSSECCFNNRCWSNDLVSQCADEISSIGGLGEGTACNNDFECTSLCCGSAGVCSPHNTKLTTPIYCEKEAGQACVISEFCKREPVTQYKKVKTGIDPNTGRVTCAWFPTVVQKNGSCVSNICRPPTQDSAPATIDYTQANACTDAVNP